jgi:phosphate transport system protein
MPYLIRKEIERLKKSLLSLTAIVEGRFQSSLQSLLEMDNELAAQVVNGDNEIDDREVALEEECLKIMALHQPVANDLRLIVSVLKINNDLERMADLTVNMASRVQDLSTKLTQTECPYDLAGMGQLVNEMLRTSLDSLVKEDTALAHKCIAMDEQVDDMHRENFVAVKRTVREQPEKIDYILLYLSVSRYLERIADLATNIAEDVVYLIDAEIIRHGGVKEKS